MLLVLDSNEYIFALGLHKKHFSEKLIERIFSSLSENAIRIPRMVVEEVKSNLTAETFKDFILLIRKGAIPVDEDISVPFELGVKYETLGFKASDALIGAYAEYVGADALVSENRHFLSRHANLPFKVLTAEQALKALQKR
ncbi:MAG: type II toxin-antitoxin system VapC family toxin [Candidatus Omnitrophica bacterium]|nr:type II toxin-antitoxin system VapC family toxin [Candidatus Omnitrophota bacterium]